MSSTVELDPHALTWNTYLLYSNLDQGHYDCILSDSSSCDNVLSFFHAQHSDLQPMRGQLLPRQKP